MSGNSPVDEPPGSQGAQAPNPPDLPPVPEWGPGENPPGTNPPVDPPVDPATVPIPGSVPTHDQGGSTPITPSDPPAGPPVNLQVPYVSFAGDTCSCTLGEWDHEPQSYSYEWLSDGTTPVGINAPTYTAVSNDVGHTITCVVTATNDFGSTAAPPSNGIEIT